ncbi:uncharacterized protein LOC121876603 [Homarus americanus]|uniref:uncharacterized protein LOC121876603 n=1 Tax=Homarus americanus TaxID=6706 RepID=UPI001C444C78|nr:uncharacterized protein LOC121876603 [Homarus americanus]
MGRVLQLVGVAALVMWAGPAECQEDLLAVESSVGGVRVAAPPSYLTPKDNRVVSGHQQQQYAKYPVRKQLGEIMLPSRPKAPRSRNPITGIGQQIGEYMRRISDYFYWFISGSPPITRKKAKAKQRAPGKGLVRKPYRFRGAPIRQQNAEGEAPVTKKQLPMSRRLGRPQYQVVRDRHNIPYTQLRDNLHRRRRHEVMKITKK